MAQKQTVLPASTSDPASPESGIKSAAYAPQSPPADSMHSPVAAPVTQPAAPIEGAR